MRAYFVFEQNASNIRFYKQPALTDLSPTQAVFESAVA